VAYLCPLGRIERDYVIVTILAYSLFGLGCLVWLVGEVLFLTATYRRGWIWFLTCLFIPFVSLIFFLTHLMETWRPVAISTAGVVIACIGYRAGGFAFVF
jgi:hypothetical protein